MLGFGGFGGLVNMSYGMNAMVHNTSWVTAHFHLIFGGTVVIMYFAIAYAIWPAVTGRAAPSLAAQRLQLWLWFAGMLVMTLPWHYLGLLGQWRRVATFNYADPIIAGWGPWVVVSLIGGVILLASGWRFVLMPVMQGRAAGIDAFEAICRALGITPGSPAGRQPTTNAKAQPATRVAWSADLLNSLAKATAAGESLAGSCAGCHGRDGRAV